MPTFTYYVGATFNLFCLYLCWRFSRRKPEASGIWAGDSSPLLLCHLLYESTDNPGAGCVNMHNVVHASKASPCN